MLHRKYQSLNKLSDIIPISNLIIYVVLLLLYLLPYQRGFGQNQKRIIVLDSLIKVAVSNQNYEKAADLKDEKIELSELQIYITNEVKRLSKGRQIPTSRISNLITDFSIWNY